MAVIDFRGGEPVYIQLKQRLRGYIISGVFKPDERMPSVRELASGLSVNPNPIQRAYRELEEEGYIYTVSGRGSFAASGEQVYQKRCDELKSALRQTVKELAFLGLSRDELISMVKEEYTDDIG